MIGGLQGGNFQSMSQSYLTMKVFQNLLCNINAFTVSANIRGKEIENLFVDNESACDIQSLNTLWKSVAIN